MIEDMFVSFDTEKLQKKKLMIATPMYGGQCTGEFCLSLFETGRVLTRHNIPHDFQDILGESLITRARNFLADHFVRSNKISRKRKNVTTGVSSVFWNSGRRNWVC